MASMPSIGASWPCRPPAPGAWRSRTGIARRLARMDDTARRKRDRDRGGGAIGPVYTARARGLQALVPGGVMRREHHDVVIVGGGAAGCVLAARLSEDTGR